MACEQFGQDVEFEMSIANVDKPKLDLLSLEQRLKAFTKLGDSHGPTRVWVTNCSTFVEKADRFGKTRFIVGMDTAKRICNPKYAGSIDTVVDKLRYYGARFAVFGRDSGSGLEEDLGVLPMAFRELCTLVPGERKYQELSSSEIRKGDTLLRQ
jgi:hypothetical protein